MQGATENFAEKEDEFRLAPFSNFDSVFQLKSQILHQIEDIHTFIAVN